MGKTFREYHLLRALEGYDPNLGPLDVYVSGYFKLNRAIGSKDRFFIGETIYEMVRFRGLIDHLCGGDCSWEERLELLQRVDLTRASQRPSLPPHIRASFPPALFSLIETSLGLEKALEFCAISNTSAPTTIRTNVLKTTRQHLYSLWRENHAISLTKDSVWGIQFEKRQNFSAFPEFQNGLFEVQDEASQIVANLVEAKPGDLVLDFCAGSGGKALAFAHRLQGKGQIFLHDIRKNALERAKRRLKRAGIQNAQTVLSDGPALSQLRGKCDWILVDAPCSGSGTLRRNPDIKWKFSQEVLENLVRTQREIFQEALMYLAPSGKIVYATCSVLTEENRGQVDYFEQAHGLSLHCKPFQSFPTSGGMDGFFAATLRLKGT